MVVLSLIAMVHNKSTQAKGKPDTDVIVIEKKRRLSIPKDLNLVACWNIIGPELAEELNEGYTHIPYFLEANAYKIGHIFVPIESKTRCFCVTQVVKIIGPISDFMVKDKRNTAFLNPNINTVKRQPDVSNLRMVLTNRKKVLEFAGYNCLFIDRPVDMVVDANVTIDRSSHADLAEAKWFGMITGVLVAKSYQLKVLRGSDTRTTYIGEDVHTVFFRYEICEINSDGVVTKTSKKKIDVRWASMLEQPRDSLPLPKFNAISNR